MPWVLTSDSLVYIVEPVASAMQSSWSVLIIIFCISKELQSFTRVHFFSALTHSWLCPFQLSLHSGIAFAQSTGSPCPLPIPLVDSFIYTSSVSEHVTPSAEAVSMSESSTFSLGKSSV